MTVTLPNLLTLLRMGLVPWFLIEVLQGRTHVALAVFLTAGVTDALDGFIARFFDQRTDLGAFIDPIADKLLLMTAFVVLAVPVDGHLLRIPLWIAALVLTRDALIMLLSLLLFLAQDVKRFPPTALSKATTATQIGAVVLVLTSRLGLTSEVAAVVALYLVAFLTVTSGLDYIWRTNRLVVEKHDASA